MNTNFFIPELNNHDVQELWFQQDGATCHTARATIDLLKDTFGDRLISRFGPVNWPPRSCDLTSLDYFLWSYVKSLVYADKPQTIDHLEDYIHRVIADIRPQMLEKVIENWTSRLDYIRANSDEDINLNESDCKEYEENADVIDNIPVNTDTYFAKDRTEGIPHNSNVPGRLATRNVLRPSRDRTSFAKHKVNFTENNFDFTLHPQWSCLVPMCP
ncbi:DUF4817 domain-containing protein [Trichonephila clavipes]|nr:DUF4817 domain-containing protein [Trichonephila clavipes]